MSNVAKTVLALFFLCLCAGLSAGGAKETPLSDEARSAVDRVYAIRDRAMMLDLARSASPQYVAGYVTQYQGALDSLGLADPREKALVEGIIRFEMMQVLEMDAASRERALEQIRLAYAGLKKLVEQDGLVCALSLRALGDCKTRYMRYQGGMAAIELSNDAKKLYERAIGLDPNEYQAYLGLGTWYLFAPSIAGGDPQTALRALDMALRSPRAYDRYLAFAWQAFCQAKLLQKDKAIAALRQGIGLSPGNSWLLGIQDKLQKGKDLFAGYQ
jgi:tetratricopeptide (TPR) repeat protein